MGRIVRASELSAPEWLLLARALCLLPLIAAGVALWGFGRVRTGLARLAPDRAHGPARRSDVCLQRASAIARVVRIAARRGPFHARCLHESLLLWWLLRRRGVDSTLRVGVRRGSSGDLEAHAWVELCGLALNDRESVVRRYAPFEFDLGGATNSR